MGNVHEPCNARGTAMMFMRGMIHTFAAFGVIWPNEIGYDVLDVCYRCVIVAPANPTLWGW